MREAAPGRFEDELTAASEWVFRRFNSQGPGYFALSATGPNTVYSHYHRGLRKLQDGDIVQFDYAPDYKDDTSDISRVFPANGKFTARQREFYEIYLRLYQALMACDHAWRHDYAGGERCRREDGGIIATFKFTDPKIKEAATRFAAQYQTGKPRNGLGHGLGMEVHDVTNAPRLVPAGGALHDQARHLDSRREPRHADRGRDSDYRRRASRTCRRSCRSRSADIEKLMREPGHRRAKR